MALSYPHKATVITFLVCAFAVAGMAAYVGHEKSLNQASYQANVVAAAGTGVVENDFPTSTDWQKDFPKLPETSATKTLAKNSEGSGVEEETLTDQFGKSFFAQYMQLQQNGQTENMQAVQSTVDQAIDDLAFTADQPTFYEQTAIRTSAKNDSVSIRAYANTAGSLFYSGAPRTDAIAIATEALESGDLKQLSKLDPIIASYSTLLKKYLALSVPSDLASYHLDLVNSVSAMLFVTQGLKKTSSDPVQALVALSVYGSAQDSLRQSFIQISDYLDSQGIAFSAQEGGRIFGTIY